MELIARFACFKEYAADPGMALRQFGELVHHLSNHPEWHGDLGSLGSEGVMRTLAEMLGASQFLWNDFLRLQHERFFPFIRDPMRLEHGSDEKLLTDRLQAVLASLDGPRGTLEAINRFKDREMFRAALRKITRRATMEQFSRELTDLAGVVIRNVFKQCHARLAQRYGAPRLEDGTPCESAVMAIGKYGGEEMGFASDLELLFVYDGKGETDGKEKLSNAFFFQKLVGAFVNAIKHRDDGIFEIDLRLRPYGEKGPLATSLETFEEYYIPQGGALRAMQYERLTMVKLRPICGSPALVRRVMNARDAFVYSEHPLDYADIERLRALQIKTHAKKEGRHAKYGSGGLVDLEYYIQAKQIENGAKDVSLRESNTLLALARLRQAGVLGEEMACRLTAAHNCLSRVIDGLRMVQGRARDLFVPDPGSRAFEALGRRAHYANSKSLQDDLTNSTNFCRSLWERAVD